MAEWSAERQSPRLPIELPLLHEVEDEESHGRQVGWTRNLSEGGACIEIDGHLPLLTPLHIHLETDRGIIEVDAQVVWEMEGEDQDPPGSEPTAGGVLHGVAFTHLAPDQLQTLRELLAAREPGWTGGVRLTRDLTVTCEPPGASGPMIAGHTSNVSRGGLLLRLSQPIPPGTVLSLTFDPPKGRVKAEGEIVWVDPPERRHAGEPIRHGLRFTALGWSRAQSLALLLTDKT